jgi:hypothetical protein
VSRRLFNNRAWARKIAFFHWRCYYCANALRMRFEDFALEPEHELTKDHIIPLCRGGADVLDNIVPACLRCNRMKNRMTAAEFINSRRCPLLRPEKNRQSTGISFNSVECFSLEETDEPGLLETVTQERDRVSWAWRNPYVN